MTAHNHDLDPSCPETVTPDGTVRGACMDQAQIVSTGNEREDRITITVDRDIPNQWCPEYTDPDTLERVPAHWIGKYDAFRIVAEYQHNVCASVHGFTVEGSKHLVDGWQELMNVYLREIKAQVLRAVEDCEAVRVAVDAEGAPAGYTMVVADMHHACGRTHSYTKVYRSIDLYPDTLDSAKRKARDAVLRDAKDCEMGIGTPDRAPDAPTGRLAHREGCACGCREGYGL